MKVEMNIQFQCFLNLIVIFDYAISVNTDTSNLVNSVHQKNHKKLKKEEGAIRLVGSANRFEGKNFERGITSRMYVIS